MRQSPIFSLLHIHPSARYYAQFLTVPTDASLLLDLLLLVLVNSLCNFVYVLVKFISTIEFEKLIESQLKIK